MSDTPALEFRNLEVAYTVRGIDREVLRNVSFSIAPGEAYGLVGESGCGKSTAAFAAMRYLPRNGKITGGSILFEGNDIAVFAGPMVTVLGTSLQNRDLLQFFHESTWRAIGLEMEGAYYQKAIQSASKIRKSINPDVKVRYAYYASDNPLETGATLASGGLGTSGVKPTYLITQQILKQILN